MRLTNHRIFDEFRLPATHWAILLAASYYLPSLFKEFMFEVELEQEGNFSADELLVALASCIRQGWIIQHEYGIVLTDEGRYLKEEISTALLHPIYVLRETVDSD